MQDPDRKFSPLSGGLLVAFMLTLSTVGGSYIRRLIEHAKLVGYFENRHHERFLQGTPGFDHWMWGYKGLSWLLIGFAAAAVLVVMRDLSRPVESE